MTSNPELHLWLIPLLPLLGFLMNGLMGRRMPKPVVSAVALIATVIPFGIVLNAAMHFKSLALPYMEQASSPWIAAGNFRVDYAFALDELSLVMLLVVTGVGFLIHLYSVGYMAHEEGYWRFFAYLNLFMFFMSVLVLAENFLLVFVGWEGVGLASYLLIGFYFTKKSAADAGKKAFIVNRIGDFGFLLAMFLLIAHFGTLSFSSVFAQIGRHPEWQGGVLTAIALFLVLGAAGKSAQIPLYIWLPDAMEGPTPVSALIHAATMVTAGIYMVVRCHTIFDRSPMALTTVAIIGAATAFFAATIGIVQTDIKRVLAYSTVSQLGYMFLGCGVGAYSAAIFHLVTHAFFKGLLFLAAGSVIHAVGGEQDMRLMGDLRKSIPITFWTMTVGVFAIAAVLPFGGFFSKDAILAAAFASPHGGFILWAIGLITALMTSFYMFRLWYLTFLGVSRAGLSSPIEEGAVVHARSESTLMLEDVHAVHESPWIMLGPLVILAILSVVGGWIGIPEALHGSNWFAHFLDPVVVGRGAVARVTIVESHGTEITLTILAFIAAAIGLFLADTLYRRQPGLPKKLATQYSGAYKLLEHKYWVDELYGSFIVTPLLLFSQYVLAGLIDFGIVNGTAHGAAAAAQGGGGLLRRIQSGNIRSYAGWLAAGAAAIIALAYFGYGTGTHFHLR